MTSDTVPVHSSNMDMSMANRLGTSPREAEDNEHFETAGEVGEYFRELFLVSGQILEEPMVTSSETLKSFLESIGIYNRSSLRQFLTISGLSTNPGSYTRFKQEYDPLLVDQVLYLIDEEFLVRNHRNVTNPYAPPPPAKRIEIMMSAILWADQIYPSCRRTDWKIGFMSFPCASLMNHLNWLGKVNQRDFLREHELGEADARTLKEFWEWFETHDQRPIRLAFAMACHGMVRNVMQELGILWSIIAELGELNKYPPPIGNMRIRWHR